MNIYLVTVECDDTYYPAHPTRIAFGTRTEAEQFIKSIEPDDEEILNYYGIKEIEVVSDMTYARENLFKKRLTNG